MFIFIIFNQKYARFDGSDDDDDRTSIDAEEGIVRDEFFHDNFIDGSAKNDHDQDFATNRLTNVTGDLQKALLDKPMYEYLGYCSEPKNFVPDSFDNIEYDFDEFGGFVKRIGKLNRDLK